MLAAGVTDTNSIASTTRSALSRSSLDGIRTSGGSPLRFTRPKAAALVNAAVSYGSAIEQSLQDLQKALAIADRAGTVSVNANRLDRNGSRISVVNIGAQMGRLLDRIDKFAKAAAVGNGNLLSSRGRSVRIQTSAFGGRLDVAPQPLDVEGLGLSGLNLLSNGGIIEARNKVARAGVLAGQRMLRLDALQRALGDTYQQYSAFQQVARDFSLNETARGAVINLSG